MNNSNFTSVREFVGETKELFTEHVFRETAGENISTDLIIGFGTTELNPFVSTGIEQKMEHSLTGQDFIRGGFLASESWTKVESFQARIIEIDKNIVVCECIIDKENKEFEIREFRRELFNHLGELKVNMPLILICKERAGSARIDIKSGKNIVDMNFFELKELYNGLENSALTQPFK